MKFILKLLLIFITVWTVTRGAIYLIPGDPVDYLIGESLIQTSEEKTIAEIHRRMDLNFTPWQRITKLPQSESLITNESTLKMVRNAFKNSATLTAITLLLTLIITALLLLMANFSRTLSQYSHAFSILLASVPIFISGPIFLFFFSLKLNLFPVINHPILPALCLSIYLAGFWFRSISQKLNAYKPHSAAQGARARGLNEFNIFIFYILAPCSASLVRFFCSQIGNILNGSLIVEIIFQWHGLGFLLSDAVLKRDYPVIEICILLVSLISLSGLQIGKWLEIRLEPRQS